MDNSLAFVYPPSIECKFKSIKLANATGRPTKSFAKLTEIFKIKKNVCAAADM
jgi:hypothetical protein